MSDRQTWFAARLLLESQHPGDLFSDRLYEEKIIVLRAATEEAARGKAEEFGRAAEETYLNADEQTVQWVFSEVLDIKELFDENIQGGTEVYYSFLHEEDLAGLPRALRAGEHPANTVPASR